jgi:hypothetical protein
VTAGRRLLYLHGFASSPGSRKGRAFDDYFSARGHDVLRLDLRLPDRDRLRISAMIAAVAAARPEGAVLVGSSLGGLVAARVAERSPGVVGCVLLAPAIGFAERWRARLGAEGFERWRAGAPIETPDHAGGPPLRVDFGFFEDAAEVDREPLALALPLLVFHGRDDDVVDIAGSRALVAASSRARLVELDDGHTLEKSLPLILPEARDFIALLEQPS